MNFTREPIIETIITPKDGSKLVVRSSKSEGQEEYTVDAVEVVSFGQALFFRSTEKPKSFLVPVGDYEVVEAKENRVVLKNASFERTIKIGGGREAPIRREAVEKQEEDEEETSSDDTQEESQGGNRFDRKRDGRRRHRSRRRPQDDREAPAPRNVEANPAQDSAPSPEESPAPKKKEDLTTNHFTSLIPPPKTLISDSIKKYKEMQTEAAPEPAPEKPEEPRDEGDPNTISRTTALNETFQTTSTFFSNLTNWTGF